MTALPVPRIACLVAPALLLLAGCGSSSAPSSSSASASVAATPSASASAGASAALTVALSASDISGSVTQKSDGLLGSTPNTDARVFVNSDNTLLIEIDVVADTSASAATSDYASFQGAAAKQVATQTSTSAPSIGQQANEYVGTDGTGKNADSLSFREGSFIVVITLFSTGAVAGPTLTATVETIANTQDTKIKSVGA